MEEVLVVAMVLWWTWVIRAAIRAAMEGIAEGEAAAARNRQNYWFGIYVNLTRADWESLGISRGILHELVGEQNYKKLIRKWYNA